MPYTILGSRSFVNSTLFALTQWDTACIRVVAIRTNTHENEFAPLEWKAYIGIARGIDPEREIQSVAGAGSPLTREEALGFFPHLDPERYKAW